MVSSSMKAARNIDAPRFDAERLHQEHRNKCVALRTEAQRGGKYADLKSESIPGIAVNDAYRRRKAVAGYKVP